jgi:multiple sugar transport system permease protein
MLKIQTPSAKVIFFSVLAFYLFFLLGPVYWMAVTALKTSGEVFALPPTLIPRDPTLANFAKVWATGQVGRYVANTLVVSGSTALITTALAALAAYGFAKFRFRGRKALMLTMIGAQMFPTAVVLLSLYTMAQATGLLDTRTGLVVAHLALALPASIYILYSYLVNLPDDLIQAARVDGAPEHTIFLELGLPLIAPGLITVFLYSFMWSWNDLLFALTLVTSDANRTVGPGLYMTFLGELDQDWGAAMAASLACSAPIILIFGALQRYFIQGLMAGAVK